MKNINYKLLCIITITLQLFSCELNKEDIENQMSENCLILIPGKYHNDADFNPKWLSKNKIRKIIERVYFDGNRESLVYSNVLEFNSVGYLTKQYHNVSNSELYSSNITNFESRYDYKYQEKDSFLIQEYPIFPFENNGIEIPDSLRRMRELSTRVQIFNFKSVHIIKNNKNEIIRKYNYNRKGKLLEIKGFENKVLVKIKYIDSNKIQIDKNTLKGDIIHHLITLDNQGKIIENYRENANATSYFVYNENGEMIEEKLFFNDRPPNYFTYEYLKI